MLRRFGTCTIEVPRKSLPRLLIDEVLNPFYIFQVLSFCLWFWDGYVSYASCILVISVLGVAQNTYETISNIQNIRRLARYECKMSVVRNNENKEVMSSFLVPGDIVILKDNLVLPCDMILISG